MFNYMEFTNLLKRYSDLEKSDIIDKLKEIIFLFLFLNFTGIFSGIYLIKLY